ncbi:hypothetical protein B0T22DRAFT_498173 [Podospora appendiculata]|uniref:Heavy metal tolerance protein n=1 Tax=Podospora appendiculata TaxID=314037 RepID=A0AAE0X8F5_9PEZI|nr:hypothetical protein B0T22DRAFT_498173 [Podospora appendiculata]
MGAPIDSGPLQRTTTAEFVSKHVQPWYPVVLAVAFLLSAGVHSIHTPRSKEKLVVPTAGGPGGKPLPATKRKRGHEQPRVRDVYRGALARRVCQCVTAAITLTFLTNGAAIAIHALQARGPSGDEWPWWCSEERTVYIVGSTSLYVYVLITLIEWSDSPNIVHCIIWTLGLVGEAIILISFASAISSSHHVVHGVGTRVLEPAEGADIWDFVDLGIGAVRLGLLMLLVCLYAVVTTKGYLKERQCLDEGAHQSDESVPLLNGNGTNYHTQAHDEDTAFYRPDKLPHNSWFEYCRGYSVFFPYLWPSDSLKLQGVVLLCFILAVFQRVVNILVPTQIGTLADAVCGKGGTHQFPWLQMGLLVVYKLLQGPSGLLGSLRSILWNSASQHTYRTLATAAFEHVHSLSLDFHLSKRTGEVLSALNKGASINKFLEQVTFQVLPVLVDLVVAIIYFHIRADQRRDMVNADREEEAVKSDSITSYETVKYFNAETFEFARYWNAITTFQVAEAKVTWGINYMNMCQFVVFMSGFFVAMMTCAFEITQGKRTVGDLTILLMYFTQLRGPLSSVGTLYRTIQQAMISSERLLELFKIQPTVVDKPDAEPLFQCSGQIKWNHVGFTYGDDDGGGGQALHDLSFECKPGTTTAFVGESDGGKSTVFRLMFRFYNCQVGSIEIDSRNVVDLAIDSVRRYISVVPQDITLSNGTLMYNLMYANPTATEKDVFEACRAAGIHDHILSFPDGYLTKVGERGLRLSGGEKQRVAIARMILKKPNIIMLDEATSALDGETEQDIQSNLIRGNFGRGCTLLIIAHRLSTITHADQIFVLHGGTAVEMGTHDELLALKGRYASMWESECTVEGARSAASTRLPQD